MGEIKTDYKITLSESQASRPAEWLAAGRGMAVWGSLNLSEPGRQAFTPGDWSKPYWWTTNEPIMIVTEPAEVGVVTYTEVKRRHVALRRGAQGLTVKLTDASARWLHKAVEKAGAGAVYQFDYGTQEAVILVPAKTVSLAEWQQRE